MTLYVPTQFPYQEYVRVGGERLQSFLLEDSKNNYRWRKDSDDRIHGGARRTYLPFAHNPVDRLFFGGTSSFRKMINLCIGAANSLMSEITDEAWNGNRVIINKMPPDETLAEHIDPTHFQDGAVVVGVGEAHFLYRCGDQVQTLEDPIESLMYVPPNVPHWVENCGSERISIVVAHDTQLASGKSAIGQFVFNQFR